MIHEDSLVSDKVQDSFEDLLTGKSDEELLALCREKGVPIGEMMCDALREVMEPCDLLEDCDCPECREWA